MNFTSDEIDKIWAYIDLDGYRPSDMAERWWRIKGEKLKRLQAISDFLGHPELKKFLGQLDTTLPEDQNYQVRLTLSPILKNSHKNQNYETPLWIVKNWGGIGRIATKSIENFMADLDGFDDISIQNFIKKHGWNRISSWSKLLAFYDCKNHAIYDARTSIALNCALDDLERSEQFYMPVSRNVEIKKAYDYFRLKQAEFHGYEAYLTLIKQIAAIKDKEPLHIEMAIFANAPDIAKEFMRQKAI